VSNASFSADGSTIFVATDGGGEQALLLALDAKTLAEKGRYVEAKPATARIDDFVVSKAGDRLALLINAGNRSEVRLLDAKTLKPAATVAMPLGTGDGLRFTKDGKLLTLHWSTPSVPTDLYSIDVKSGKAQPLRKETRPTLAKLPAIDASITEMTTFDGKKVPINLYLPKGVAKGKKLPTMVIVHGGPASSYAVRWSTFTRFYSAQGFAIVEPNVRGSTGFGRAYEQADDGTKRMDAVKDLEAVGKWVAAQPWADPDRLVVYGGSYGGYMTLMGVAHQGSIWKAGVDLFGIYNWRTFMDATSGLIRDIFQKELGTDQGPAFLESISPSSAVDKIAVPLFVFAGQNDPRVPRSESDQIVASLRARSVPVEYMVALNEGHSLDRKENVLAFLARSTRFLEKTLKLGK
jgi:dipeptidyl aminopeptidase/acylaminoacyl peptidase